MAAHTNVFISDNNALVRFGLSQLIGDEDDMVVVGSIPPSSVMVDEIESARSDILIIEIPSPRDKGIKLLKKISKLKIPVIIFTESDDEIANDLIPLLEVGVVGFILKPGKKESLSDIKDKILHEIRLNTPKHKKLKKSSKSKNVTFLDPLKVIAIGSSTGGPEALAGLVKQIPENYKHGIVFVQHMPADFMTRFAKRLDKLSKIHIKEAEEGDIITAGVGLIAPGNKHMVFKEVVKGNRRHAKVVLTNDPPVWNLRPTVDYMMTSIAPIYKNNIVGVVLTGMGEDGVIGMRAIKQNGGKTIVQNKETSVVFGMGQQVIKNNLADEVLPIKKIFPRALQILNNRK